MNRTPLHHTAYCIVPVLIRNKNIDVSTFDYNTSQAVHEISTSSGPSVRVAISYHRRPSSSIFLIHSSCYHFLQNHVGFDNSPVKIFKLCQALQPDRERFGGLDFDLSDCLNPLAPVIPFYSQSQEDLTGEPNWSLEGPLLQLPPEIIFMIIEMLPPSSLIRFLCSSKQTLEYAHEFCDTLPHFYRCVGGEGVTKDQWPALMLMILSKFTPSQYSGLDKRWEVICKLSQRVKMMQRISVDCPPAPTVDPTALFESVDHSYGYQELFAAIPENPKTFRVYRVLIDTRSYVCGIEFQTDTTNYFLGRASRLHRTLSVSQSVTGILRFVMDSLGVRSVSFGDSTWSDGDPKTLQCWEGFSRKEESYNQIRVIQDGSKIRQINWCRHGPPYFEEGILMRNEHAFSCREPISEDNFIEVSDENILLQARLGSFTVETVWLRAEQEEIDGITIYGYNPTQDLLDITTHKHSIPANVMARFFPLHGPAEVISEFVVHKPVSPFFSRSLAVTLRTNWNRQCLLGFIQGNEYTSKILRPPSGHHIKGFYFQRSGMAFGAIYAPGLRGLACPSTLPSPEAPEIPPEYELSPFHVFASYARLPMVKKIRIYYDSNWCIGLRVFYLYGSSEALGRACGNHFQEFAIPQSARIHRVWITFAGVKYRMKQIEFSTDPREPPRVTATPFEIKESTIIAWWFREDRDIIHFSEIDK